MTTQLAPSSMNRLFFLLLSFSTVACTPVQFACPNGFTLTAAGRCISGDAGAMPPGDGGPLADDAGTDAATSVDAGMPAVDAASIVTDDAAVEMADAYVTPPPDACTWGTWYADADGDHYGNPSAMVQGCTQPIGSVSDATDCDDTHVDRHPGATEICNGVDDNCNGSTDEGVMPTFYYDGDADGHGDPTMPTSSYCIAPPHYVTSSDDCDDHVMSTHPGATEVCNDRDDDCDGMIDEGVKLTFYVDADHDGYGAAATVLACTVPTGYAAAGGDCADSNATIHPGATEVCDFIDQDCNGVVDDGMQIPYYADCDGDRYAPSGAATAQGCPSLLPPSAPACSGGTWTSRAPVSTATTDCADNYALAYPGSLHFDANPAYTVGTVNHWDWNCDGIDTQRVATATGTLTCAPPGGLSAACQMTGEHWDAFVPRCGQYNNLHTCVSSPSCIAGTPWTLQTCR